MSLELSPDVLKLSKQLIVAEDRGPQNIVMTSYHLNFNMFDFLFELKFNFKPIISNPTVDAFRLSNFLNQKISSFDQTLD